MHIVGRGSCYLRYYDALRTKIAMRITPDVNIGIAQRIFRIVMSVS